jgi:hypothetical protein
VQRIGGASSRDWAFRRQLYFYVGLMTVASGKIEAAMKRAILLGRGDLHAAMVDVDLKTTSRGEVEVRATLNVLVAA